MIVLSFAWVGLLIVDLTTGLGPVLQAISIAIWALFVLDFAIEIVVAPHKLDYLRRNWLTAVSLALPALRILWIFRALRLLRAARAARSLSLVRLLTSLNRGVGAARRTLGRRGVGYVIAMTTIVTFAGAAGMASFENQSALHAAGYAAPAGAGLNSYGEALWWTAMIMTTMGSAYWPQTFEGRLLCWLLSLYAFAIFGYITATIASYFVGRPARPEANAPSDMPDPAALRAEIAALRQQLAIVAQRDDVRPAPPSQPERAAAPDEGARHIDERGRRPDHVSGG